MTSKQFIATIVVFALVIVGVVYFTTGGVRGGAGTPAQAGLTTFNSNIYTSGTLTSGGIDTVATTTSSTLSLGDLQNTVLAITPNTASITTTLPTFTAMSALVPNVGDETSIFVYNATTTSGTTVTIAGNTNVTLLNASSSAAIGAGKAATLDFIRVSATAIIALFSPNQ